MIIGSTCIKHHFPDFPRKPKDLDYVTSEQFPIEKCEYYNKNADTRIEIVPNAILQAYILEEHGYIPKYCPKDALFTLKISHSFWSLENGSWDKHMWDIQWLKAKGCILIEPLFYDLYKYWNDVHGKNKRSKLDMSAEDFFDNIVNFPIEHDTLHETLLQHEYFNGQEKPTYSLILKDGCEVDVDEKKYLQLTELQKYNLVFEEVAVMALERFNTLYYKKAYTKMLKKFILSHAPIWEALWIIQNHKLLVTTIPFDFIKFLKMETITFEEISQIIKDNLLQKYLFEECDCYLFDENGDDDLDDYNIKVIKAKLAEANFTNYEQVERVCNSDEMYCVIHFKDPDIYVKLTGEYDSYGGYDHEYYSNVTQVFPKQITVTIYE